MTVPRQIRIICIGLVFLFLAIRIAVAESNLDEIRAELKSGERNRIVSAIDRIKNERLEKLYDDVHAVFSDSRDRVVRRHALLQMSRSGAPQLLDMICEAIDDPKADNIGVRHLGAREFSLQRIVKSLRFVAAGKWARRGQRLQ